MHRILIHIIQTSQIRTLKRQMRIAELKPDLAATLFMASVSLTCADGVNLADNIPQFGRVRGRLDYKMVVVREERPSLQDGVVTGCDP